MQAKDGGKFDLPSSSESVWILDIFWKESWLGLPEVPMQGERLKILIRAASEGVDRPKKDSTGEEVTADCAKLDTPI